MADTLISIEPATGATLWTGSAGDPDAEVSAARAAWPAWAAKSLAYRVETLRRFANVVRGELEPFADLIARETGKPLWEARTEVEAVINKVEISISAYADRTPQRRLEGAMGARVAVRHKPHGVLAVLGPYNFPAHLPNGHIVPALIAGNTVVFKPSEKTPAVGEYLAKLYVEAGIPEGVVRVVQGGAETGKALAAHPGLDGLLFTGSARAGLALNRQFADTPHKILALEMGGNNPIVVWDAKDLPSAAAIVAQSAFLSAGQRCTAARRLIVRDGAHDDLIGMLTVLIDRLIVDHPHASPQPFMGPVIDNAAADQLQEAFLELMGRGGKAIRRLDRQFDSLPFLTPALIDVTEVERRPDAELFGPVLQMIRVPDFDSAIAEANATRYGLSASLIGGPPELYDRFWAGVRAGVINWNSPTNGAPSKAPFGGIGLSGNHRPSAYYAADYAAYPVTSSEADSPRATIGIGLADAAIAKKRPPKESSPPPEPSLEPAREANEPAAEMQDPSVAAEEARLIEEARLAAEAGEGQEAGQADDAAAAEEARQAAEAAAAEEARLAAEAAAEEEARLTAAAAAAEEARLAAEAAAAEEARLAAEAAAAEEARLAAEAAAAEEARLAAEAAAAEEARLAAEAAAAEEARLAAEAAAAEEARLAAEAAAAEEARLVAEAAAEEARLAAEAAAAEEARLAAEAAAAEEARLAAEAAAAEEARLAAEAAAAEEARLASEAAAAEEARLAEEARRAAEEQAAKEAQWAAEAAAEAARQEAEAAAAEEARLAAEAAAAEEARLAAEAAADEEARLAAEEQAAKEARWAAEAAAEAARQAAEAAAAEEAERAAEASAAEAKPADDAVDQAPPEEPKPRRSAPAGPVIPMVDARAERLAEEAEMQAKKAQKP